MKERSDKLKQFNARVHSEAHRYVKIAASATDTKLETIVEDMKGARGNAT